MISIGEGFFDLEIAPLTEQALQEYAVRLFAEFDLAARTLPFDDFALHLDLEQGSLRGKSAILIGAYALYSAVAQYGSFVQGVREIGAQAKFVNEEVLRKAPFEGLPSPVSVTRARVDPGVPGKLQRLFAAVARGDLSPEEATTRALALMDGDEPIPAELRRDVVNAIREIRLNPTQLELPQILGPQELPEGPTSTPRKPTPRKARDTIAIQSGRWRVEVRKEHKNGKVTFNMVPL